MKPKTLHVKYVISYFCGLNCSYCSLTKEERQQTDFLNTGFIRLTLLQLVRFYKKNNYSNLIIVLTGDELHEMPHFFEYLSEISELLQKALIDIPREQIRIKMHTNLRASEEFYARQIGILEHINTFAVADFETVYQSMYHSNKMERKLEYIQSIVGNIKYFSSLGLLNPTHMDKCRHLKFDDVIDFSTPCAYPKYADREVNFVVIGKNKDIHNGCGYNMNTNLLALADRNFCSECPHSSCEMLNVEHRL